MQALFEDNQLETADTNPSACAKALGDDGQGDMACTEKRVSPFGRLPVPELERLLATLKLADLKVFVVLCMHVDGEWRAYPGLERIAALSGLTRAGVCLGLKRLIEGGAVVRVKEHDRNGRGRRTTFKIVTGDKRKQVLAPTGGPEKAPMGVAQEHTIGTKRCCAAHIGGLNGRARGAADPWAAACEAMTTDVLRTERFHRAWDDWTTHRQQIRKPLTPLTIQRMIRRAGKMGHDAAIEAIEKSIEHGWRIFYPSNGERIGGGNGDGRSGSGDDIATNTKYRRFVDNH